MSKPRFLLAWELGGGFGHIGHLAGLAKAIIASDAEVVFAVRDTGAAASAQLERYGAIYQAPISIHGQRVSPPLGNFVNLLFNCGFCDSSNLIGRLLGWRSIIRNEKITAVCAEHSPTAILAAYMEGIPCMQFGASFIVPPTTPEGKLPWYEPSKNPQDYLTYNLEKDKINLNIKNALNILAKDRPYVSIEGLYNQIPSYITSLRELDVYGEREFSKYYGPITSHGTKYPTWKESPHPKIFVYSDMSPGLLMILEALKTMQVNVLLKISNAPSALETSVLPNMKYEPDRIDTLAAINRADLVIHCGQSAISEEALLLKAPAFVVPTTVERHLTAKRLVSMGAARIASKPTVEQFKIEITEMLSTLVAKDEQKTFRTGPREYDWSLSEVHATDLFLDFKEKFGA